MTDEASITRSRHLRRIILSTLAAAVRGGVEFGLDWGAVRDGFRISRISVSDDEIRVALAELTGDGLLAREWDEQQAGHRWTITAAGLDFVRARMPWQAVDPYTGGRPE